MAVAASVALSNLHHQPRCQHDGDEEGKQHGGRSIGRDRAHIGTHHAGNEKHRQKRGHHRQRCDDGWIADLGHGVDCGGRARAAVIHGPVAGNVLDDDGRIVDQNAYREDQCEETDAI